MKTKQKRILIVRPDRIGDVVLSTPIPREIKRTFPDSFVAIMLKKYTSDIYLNNPYIDKIILIDNRDDGSIEGFWRKVNEIKSYKFTHALMLLPNERINYILFFAGIPYRVGVGHKLYQFLTFTHYVNRNKYNPLRHEADYCMDLARKIGVTTNNLVPEIFLTNEEKEKAVYLRKNFLDGKKFLIGIHSTSGNSAPNWTAGSYKELVMKLIERNNVRVAITDNNPPSELLNIDDVIYPNIDKSLRESIINFSTLDLLLSASTGPMHICAALKVKTISLFCPLTACSPKLWGPLGNQSKIIMPEKEYCNEICPGNPKICTFEGKNGIDVETVFSSIINSIS
ncbi:MAG: glycosyltransferase family 9 protein [Melioribacter sp.]|uniref:glycosyltransferase family 9 protein n=1 Tax=Rosettibacter primus TaxID=3111523 RepID=UPI00247DB4B9|nr:glycosyltransferase family 9 protein [Melioribacter sp.]